MDGIRAGRVTLGEHQLRVSWQGNTLVSVSLSQAAVGVADDAVPTDVRLLALMALQAWLDWQDPVQEALTWAMLDTRRTWLAQLHIEDSRPQDDTNVTPLRRSDHSMK